MYGFVSAPWFHFSIWEQVFPPFFELRNSAAAVNSTKFSCDTLPHMSISAGNKSSQFPIRGRLILCFSGADFGWGRLKMELSKQARPIFRPRTGKERVESMETVVSESIPPRSKQATKALKSCRQHRWEQLITRRSQVQILPPQPW